MSCLETQIRSGVFQRVVVVESYQADFDCLFFLLFELVVAQAYSRKLGHSYDSSTGRRIACSTYKWICAS